MSQVQIEVPQEQIEAFCRKWKVKEFALFGSVLTEEFRPDSDLDVMISFEQDVEYNSAMRSEMKGELEELFGGRNIDLVRKQSIANPFIRYHALTHKLVVYAA